MTIRARYCEACTNGSQSVSVGAKDIVMVVLSGATDIVKIVPIEAKDIVKIALVGI